MDSRFRRRGWRRGAEWIKAQIFDSRRPNPENGHTPMSNPKNHRTASWHSKDPVESVRRINRRWIVRGGLRKSAADYLVDLEQSDPPRLARSCRLALDLAHSMGAHHDPKPWFYGGLFALARASEAERHLGNHPLTRLVWESLRGIPPDADAPESLLPFAVEIAGVIRCQTSYGDG